MPHGIVAREETWRLGNRSVNRFDLYQLAVQSCDIQVRFLRALHANEPQVLADDFSGPAGLARAWLTLNDRYAAVATDTDDIPLAHAFVRTAEDLGNATLRRLALQRASVLEAGGHADIIAALNFAVCELPSRQQLVTYFRHAQFRLNSQGIIVIDTYAGPSAFDTGSYTQIIETPAGELTYQWEQRAADPMSGRVSNSIHITLPTGEHLEDLFVYDWRLWSVPEIREALREANFRHTEVHIDYGQALDGDGNPMPEAVAHDNEPSGVPGDEDLVAYVVGRV